jgi:hypothetical protein
MRSLPIALLLATLPAAMPAGADGATTTRTLLCDGADGTTMAMENEYIVGTGYGGCWFHIGHHTYDLEGLFAVGAITVHRISSVEVQFSPPIEPAGVTPIPIPIEASLDGRTWTRIAHVAYNPLSTRNENIRGTLHGAQGHARYLRIRQPRSAAQGLSGYLDGSHLEVELTPVAGDAPTAARSGTFTLSCANDIMERVDPAHPCWFGGINRYDSPSVFHTYPLDAPTPVTTITGSATFLPWRSDDYFSDGGDRRALGAHLFSSADGEHWTKLSSFRAEYGVPASFTWSGSTTARFLRVVAEYHHGVRRHPALKHVRGFLLDSSLTVTAA